MTRVQLVTLALNAGFSLEEIKVHLVKIRTKPNKKKGARKSRKRGPIIYYGMNTNAM